MAPLEGIRVVDFGRFLPGPYATWLLADLGAEVIRIENAREQAKFDAMFRLSELSDEERARYDAAQVFLRGKKNVRLDLADPEHREAAYKLIDTADVLCEDFRPGVIADIGFGAEAMMARNPKLVYCSVSACGQTGPYAQRPGHEPIALAISGLLDRLGTTEKPMFAGVPFVDLLTGSNAAIAIMAALTARGTTGRGQVVDAAMTDSAMTLLGMVMSRSADIRPVPPRGFHGMHGGIWKTRDGRFIASSDMEPRYWKAFCEALGKPEYIDKQHDKSLWEQMRAEFDAVFATRDASEWLDILGAAGTQHALVYQLDEALADPHNRARGMVAEMAGPNGSTIRHIGSPLHLSDTPVVDPQPAHGAGADTREVLASIGMEHLLEGAEA